MASLRIHTAPGCNSPSLNIQPQSFKDVGSISTSDTVDAIKEYVFSTTEHIDIALDRHDEQLKRGKTKPGVQQKKRFKVCT